MEDNKDPRVELTADQYDKEFWVMVKHRAKLVAGDHEGTTLILELPDHIAHLCQSDGSHWLDIFHR